jgi:hypothetical protein
MSECVRWLLQAIGGPVQDKLQIFVDNQGTVEISSNPVQAGRNLHVHARYFYVRDLVYSDKVEVCKISTDLQIADIGCSYKGGPNFHKLRNYLMGCARVMHDDENIAYWQSGEIITD